MSESGATAAVAPTRVVAGRAAATYRYTVFGGLLLSELPLPDLRPGEGDRPTWRFRLDGGPPPDVEAETIGRHAVDGWLYELSRTAAGFRLHFAEVYTFDISADGGDIVFYRHGDSREENIRALLVGPVLCLAQESTGAACLHGSAVAIAGQGIALLAPKHHGKSTLGLALTRAGARFVTDDAVVLDLEPSIVLRPGVQSVRLREDSVAHLGATGIGAEMVEGYKVTLTGLPASMLAEGPVPLAAVYLLDPDTRAEDEDGEAARRVPLSPARAAAMLAFHAKLPQPLMGREGSAAQLRRAARIARDVPVFRLSLVRDLARLDRVTETLLRWHRPS